MTLESLLQAPTHCSKVRKSCLLCWNKVRQTDETMIKFINFKWSEPWAFSFPELTLTENRLTVIVKGSVKGQVQHKQEKGEGDYSVKDRPSERERKTKRQGNLFILGFLIEINEALFQNVYSLLKREQYVLEKPTHSRRRWRLRVLS